MTRDGVSYELVYGADVVDTWTNRAKAIEAVTAWLADEPSVADEVALLEIDARGIVIGRVDLGGAA
jgi:hypothetical protein